MARARQDSKEDDELLAGEDQGEIGELPTVPYGADERPCDKRKDAQNAEEDLNRERARWPAEDESEAA